MGEKKIRPEEERCDVGGPLTILGILYVQNRTVPQLQHIFFLFTEIFRRGASNHLTSI